MQPHLELFLVHLYDDTVWVIWGVCHKLPGINGIGSGLGECWLPHLCQLLPGCIQSHGKAYNSGSLCLHLLAKVHCVQLWRLQQSLPASQTALLTDPTGGCRTWATRRRSAPPPAPWRHDRCCNWVLCCTFL